jgi:hypothetical protein
VIVLPKQTRDKQANIIQKRPFLQVAVAPLLESLLQIDRASAVTVVSENGLFEPFMNRNDLFSKTGSEQT